MSANRTVAIIQARMGSSRLPGKVLLDLGGKPMLSRVIDRVSYAASLDGIVVATTSDPGDDALAAFCEQQQIPYFRGSVYDVLDRYYQAALAFEAGTIVRITADCPVIDPAIIDQVVEQFSSSGADFAANRLPPPFHRTFPIGLDTEVCSFSALERAWQEAKETYQREHVMPYLYDTPGRFRTAVVNTEPDYGHLRWTVDTAEDLEVLRRIFQHFNPRDNFTYEEILAYYLSDPDIQNLNTGVGHKSMTDVDARASSRKGG